MNMTDRVAHFIANSFKNMVETTPDGPVELLRSGIKASVNHPHPQQSISLQYSIRVGDVLKPTMFMPIEVADDIVIISPLQRFVVFKLSCPTTEYNLMLSNAEDQVSIKAILIMYDNVIEGLDLTKIRTVISCNSISMLLPILHLSEVVGNVADQL